ncbi:class D sortase [Paenibacillus sp. GCM10027626]|uniref:class D sortase n=1 Tax=Paenibacillus sp. GCM10027626 TaxID=3273411 RepID=UPI0036392EBD
MRKMLGFIFIIAGGLLVATSLYLIYHHKFATEQSLQEAESLLAEHAETNQVVFNPGDNNTNKERDRQQRLEELRKQFSPKAGDVIGVLHIPKIDAKLPIIEGTDEDMLERGVGHYSPTVFPGDKEQILLSGHRDTIFRKMGDLEKGDKFIVEMLYGTFEYEMRENEIVPADDTTTIRPMGEEVLTLSTCYPFTFIGSAPDRYIIYAYPISNEK